MSSSRLTSTFLVVSSLILSGCEDSDVRLGREAINAGDYDRALNFLAIAAERNRGDASIRALISRAHARKGNLREATQAFREAQQIGLSDKDVGRLFVSADLLDAILFLQYGFEEGRSAWGGREKAERTSSLSSVTYRAADALPPNSPGAKENPDSKFMITGLR